MATSEQLRQRRDQLTHERARERSKAKRFREAMRKAMHRVRRLNPRITRIRKELASRDANGVSDRGLKFIAQWEGTVLHGYNDSAGHCTIGVGHLLHLGNCSSGELHRTISKEKALELLDSDARIAVNAVREYIDVALKQEQFDALVSFTFNCGTGALRDSTLRVRLNNGEYGAVPSELMRWVNAGGVPVQGLVNRRKAEGALFARGDYG